ncbi:MAG: 6,7-dimethyl-8-ribityllumazine synthase [Candidatus Xiphinematobacter sp.]|nr:MAG: 6,7-dimethyl-8-ribityllumazine synthase [Candidatus Xiphinematobacter sp.]
MYTEGGLQKKMQKKIRIGVVAGQYNVELSRALVDSACRELNRSDLGIEVRCFSVPGAFEVPLIVKKLAQKRYYGAIIALGVIIRGETAHGDLIGTVVTEALMQIALEFSIPIIHEVLLVDNEEQARRRVCGGQYNRGSEAAQVAVEMVRIAANL